MVITNQSPGFTSSTINSSWGTSHRIHGSSPDASTTNGREDAQAPSNTIASTDSGQSHNPSWRVRRFAAQVGFFTTLVALTVSTSSAAARARETRSEAFAFLPQYKPISTESTIGADASQKPSVHSQSKVSLDSMPTATLSDMQDAVFPRFGDLLQASLTDGTPLAEETLERTVPEASMRSSIYPDDILKEYKVLVREKHVGRLSARQQKRLAELRFRIQTISSRDDYARQAERQVKDVNASLDALKVKVTKRIAQRRAEQQTGEST